MFTGVMGQWDFPQELSKLYWHFSLLMLGGNPSEGAQQTYEGFITKLPAFDLREGPIDKGAAGYETFSL